MTSEILIALGAVAISLLFEYVPGLSTVFDRFSDVQKRLTMALLMLVLVAVVFALNCAGQVLPSLPVVDCTVTGLWGGLMAWLGALVANQTGHRVFKRG